ncbi:hypothetical protein K445DRAFT_309358 [Daldinia sp. EC12]|nr:hypothetical protein K445DRAFT_309358 [Daldinia sp. EC12]
MSSHKPVTSPDQIREAINTASSIIHGGNIPKSNAPEPSPPLIVSIDANCEELASTPNPTNIDAKQWSDSLFQRITSSMQKHIRQQQLSAEEVLALWHVALKDLADQAIMYEKDSAWTLGHRSTGGFSASAKAALASKPRAMAFLAYTDLTDPTRSREPSGQSCHFQLVIFALRKKKLFIFDTLEHGMADRANHILVQMTAALQKEGKSALLSPITLYVVDQKDSWSCGYWSSALLYMIAQRPTQLLNLVKEKDLQPVLSSYMTTLTELTGITFTDRQARSIEEEEEEEQQEPVLALVQSAPPASISKKGKEKVRRSSEPTPSEPKISQPEPIRKRPIQEIESDGDDPISELMDSLCLNDRFSHNPGPERAELYRHGELTHYQWRSDTFSTAALRPQPSTPKKWPGWDAFKSQLEKASAVPKKVTDQVKSRAQRAEARAKKRSKKHCRRGYRYG